MRWGGGGGGGGLSKIKAKGNTRFIKPQIPMTTKIFSFVNRQGKDRIVLKPSLSMKILSINDHFLDGPQLKD